MRHGHHKGYILLVYRDGHWRVLPPTPGAEVTMILRTQDAALAARRDQALLDGRPLSHYAVTPIEVPNEDPMDKENS